MIQTNADVRFVAKHKTLGFRVIEGGLMAVSAYVVLGSMEIERPPFYSDVTITEEVVIFLRGSTSIGHSAINAMAVNAVAIN